MAVDIVAVAFVAAFVDLAGEALFALCVDSSLVLVGRLVVVVGHRIRIRTVPPQRSVASR